MAANPSIQLGTDGNWAIKEDNLLAYKKDGTRFFNKEFDFTRGSFATFLDKDGLIKVSGTTDTELVTNGTFDTDSDWSKGTGWSIANGNASYDASGTSALTSASTSIVLGKIYRLKFKITTSGFARLNFTTDGSQSLFQPNGNSLNNFADGEYTFYLSAQNNSTALKVFAYNVGGGTSFSIDNVSVKEIQLDVPRIDFTDDATGHLLLEPQSTNLLTFSEDFSQSVWAKTNLSILSNSIISPEGILSADKLIPDTTSGQHKIDITRTVTNGATVSLSAFVKKGEYNFCCLYEVTSSKGRFFDLSNGTQGGTFVGTPTTSNIENYNNDWYRISISTTVPSTSARYILYVCDTISNTSFVGDNIKGIYTWGAQLEEKSFATSYIPTNGSTATRNAEVCNNSGSAQDFNSEEGVLYIESALLNVSQNGMRISISDGSSAENRITFRYLNNNQIQIELGLTNGFSEILNLNNSENFNKIAVVYNSINASVFINGVKLITDSMSILNNLSQLQFNRFNANIENFYGKTKNLKVFKRAMSDGELYLLTVTQYQSYQEMATALNYTL